MTVQSESQRAVEQLGTDFTQCPYEYLRRFREEAPAREVVFPHGARVWLVTRYEDVRALLSDPRVSKDGRRMNELFARHSGVPYEPEQDDTSGVGFDDDLSAHLLNTDPPRHTRLRRLVSTAFTARRTEALRPLVTQVVDELLDAFADQAEVDIIEALAMPLPMTMSCHLFGIPLEDRPLFQRWATKLIGAGQDPDEVAEASRNVTEYAHRLIELKRADPGEDMLTMLVQASEDGDQLSRGELTAMIFLLATAGHVSTAHSIGNALYTLLTHPGELDRLKADPALMPAAVNELLRYDGGVGTGSFRFTRTEIRLGDVVIPPDRILVLSISSANHDDAHFADPDALDLTRPAAAHLAFGHGLHYCVGAPLARMQMEIVLRRLLARYPDLRLAVAPDQVHWEESTLLRGLETLPVLLGTPHCT
jgi:cytochrome P450